MKKHLLLFFGFILTLNCYSQISFEKGYYIHNSDQKTECLIKNNDWKNNPTEFEYKLTENDKAKTINIRTVKEFGVYNSSKYIRKTVNIDKSSENLNNLSNSKKPIFIEEQLFLKSLVEGKANLYLYEDGNLKRYFYNIDESNVEQLIYKSYYMSYESRIGKNNQFRQQLWNDLKCSEIEMNDFEKLEYHKKDLIKVFVKYNNCNNSDFTNFEEKQKRDLFNLTLRPRLNSSTLSIQNSQSSSSDTDFGNELSFGFGVEAEYILPFNKNKWAVLIEPTYQSYKSEKTSDVANIPGGKLITAVKYSSIEIPISLRYYFFLNDNSKIFLNTSFVIDANLDSTIEFKNAEDTVLKTLETQTNTNFAFGIGYKLYDKYSLEMRYQTSREILGGYTYWNTDYNTLSIIFGYSFF